MNIKRILAISVGTMLLASGNLFAGATNMLTLTDDSGSTGGQVNVKIRWEDLGTPSPTLQFRVTYDTGALTFVGCTGYDNGWTFPLGCQIAMMGPGFIDVGFADFSPPITGSGGDDAMHLATITFDVIGGPGTTPVNVDPTYNDGNPDPDPILTDDGEPTDFMNSTITILGPAYDSAPIAPNGPFAFGTYTAGDMSAPITTDVSNIGEPDTTLMGDCQIMGTHASAFILTGGPIVALSVPEAGPAQTLEVACDTENLTVGVYDDANLVCTHNGTNPPGASAPVAYPLSCTILAAPAPVLGSSPQAPGVAIDFGGPYFTDDADPLAMLDISNVGNDSPLDGDCTISNSAGGVFSLAGDPVGFSLDVKDAAMTLELSCDVSVAPGVHMGELSCAHNGSNGPTSTWPLVCEVTPRATYNDTPAGLSMSGNQGNGDPTDTLTIDNIGGEVGSTLSGTCSIDGGGDPEIFLPGGGAFSMAQGASQGVDVACDGTATPGFYGATLRCIPDDPVTNPGEYTTPVDCEIDAPDPAVYVSTPYAAGTPGDKIDINEGNDPPPVDGPSPMTVLTITNGADPGDDYLDLMGCAFAGDDAASDAAISDSPTPVNEDLDPGQSVMVTFTCSTANAGMFSGTYTCPYNATPTPPPIGAPEGDAAIYPVNCEVREQFSDVEESPPSGTPQTADLMPGETADWDFEFEEMIGEGLNGILDTCGLVGDPAFSITTSTSYPQDILSGGPPLVVSVDFTDPGAGDNFHTDLNCTFTDNPDGGEPEQTMVTWPIDVTVTGRNVTFLVTKDFSDDNPAGVDVFLECNTGLPLQQQGVVHDPDAAGLGAGDFTELNFVVVDFEPGTMDCDIEETVPEGYEPSYTADYGEDGSAGDVYDDDLGCHYEELESADFVCEIYNELQPVDVTVEKQWIDDNPEYQLPTFVDITLTCDAVIYGGYYCGGGNYCIETYIDPSNPGEFSVLPYFGGTSCSATEELQAGVLTDDSDCASMSLTPGHGDDCVIVNTRLYAGIPTLSQYGLMLLALLMLGVGLIGFRRYT